MITIVLATTEGKPTPISGVASMIIIVFALLLLATAFGRRK